MIADVHKGLFLHAVDHFCRLRSFLSDTEMRASAAERSLIDYYRRVLQDYEIELFESVAPSLGTAALTVQDLSPIFDAFVHFGQAHELCDLFVSRPPVPPELYTLIEETFSTPGEAVEPSVVYYRHYTFAEIDAADMFGEAGPGRVTIWLPFADVHSPLMWAALAHEMGHALFREREIVKKLQAPTKDKQRAKILESWAEEFWADIIGTRLLGPAYLNAFVSVILTDHPIDHKPTAQHPSPAERIQCMKEYLHRMNVHLGEAGEYYTTLFDNLTALFGGPPAAPDLLLPRKTLLNLLENECRAIGFPQIYDEAMEQKATALEEKNAHGINLLSSISLDSVSLKAIRELQEKKDVTTDQVYNLLKKSEESPAPMAAILVAGWNRRMVEATEKLAEIIEAVKTKSIAAAGAFGSYAEQQYEWDRNIMKSVESSKIHQILVDRE